MSSKIITYETRSKQKSNVCSLTHGLQYLVNIKKSNHKRICSKCSCKCSLFLENHAYVHSLRYTNLSAKLWQYQLIHECGDSCCTESLVFILYLFRSVLVKFWLSNDQTIKYVIFSADLGIAWGLF